MSFYFSEFGEDLCTRIFDSYATRSQIILLVRYSAVILENFKSSFPGINFFAVENFKLLQNIARIPIKSRKVSTLPDLLFEKIYLTQISYFPPTSIFHNPMPLCRCPTPYAKILAKTQILADDKIMELQPFEIQTSWRPLTSQTKKKKKKKNPIIFKKLRKEMLNSEKFFILKIKLK